MKVSKEEILNIMKESKFSHAILVYNKGVVVDAILFDVLYNKLFELIINYKKFAEIMGENVSFCIIDEKGNPVNVTDIPIVSVDGQNKQDFDMRNPRGYQ